MRDSLGTTLADGLKVRFWGVRGSISCAGPEYVRYGGNTSCLEVTAGGRRLIFDAGSGIRTLGLELARQAPLDIDIYFAKRVGNVPESRSFPSPHLLFNGNARIFKSPGNALELGGIKFERGLGRL